jgi:flagellar biosynthesis protein FliQ
MSVDSASEFIRQTLLMTLLISAPMLLIGLAVGIVVSLIQAVTQIQEQTLSFVPKITAMIAAAVVLMPWIEGQILEFARSVFLTGTLP